MAMAAGPEYPAGQRSRRSSPSKGKPCTWRRAAGYHQSQKERCVRHHEKSQNVLESLSSKACNSNYRYQRLYRNLYNPEFYLIAYQKIQAKQGNMTAGTDGKTVDGIGMKRINALIARLKDFSYQPAPARRTYIPRPMAKSVPLVFPPLTINWYKKWFA